MNKETLPHHTKCFSESRHLRWYSCFVLFRYDYVRIYHNSKPIWSYWVITVCEVYMNEWYWSFGCVHTCMHHTWHFHIWRIWQQYSMNLGTSNILSNLITFSALWQNETSIIHHALRWSSTLIYLFALIKNRAVYRWLSAFFQCISNALGLL